MEIVNEKNNQLTRAFFIDNIRWFMIVLVVIVHTNVTYSGIGSWYFMDLKEMGILSSIYFGVVQTFSQSFFMGILFLFAGYFTPAAYAAKGIKRFMIDRFKRLGLPTLFFILVISPVTIFMTVSYRLGHMVNFLDIYKEVVLNVSAIGNTGPLWFAFALLIFSTTYAVMQHFIFDKMRGRVESFNLSHVKIIQVIFIIFYLTFLVRIFQPIGTSIYNMQLCFFSQYIVLFYIGTFAYKHNLIMKLPYNFGVKWMKLGFLFGIPFWIGIMILGGFVEGVEYVYFGGYYWQSAAYALWETFFGISMCLGLIVLFREKFNLRNSWTGFLSDNAFGVYVLHTPILVGISMLLLCAQLH